MMAPRSAYRQMLDYNEDTANFAFVEPEREYGLLHLAGIALAPSAKPETNSKSLDVFILWRQSLPR